MKLVNGLVRPEKLDAIKKGLGGLNVVALTVAAARDHSPQRHDTTVWMGREYNIGSSLKVEIRVVVHDDDVDDVIDVIMRSARTGAAGDGHVCVMAIEHRYNICSGQRDVS
jgi:nitrogen regulatory protein P-II 1